MVQPMRSFIYHTHTHTHTEDTEARVTLVLFFAYMKTEIHELPLQALDPP